jgi:hypothetical protein
MMAPRYCWLEDVRMMLQRVLKTMEASLILDTEHV